MSKETGELFIDSWFKAIEEGDTDRIQCLIDGGTDVNMKLEENSGLMYAVLMAKPLVIEKLLQNGVNPNTGDNWETLHWAVRNNSEEIVNILLSYGSNPNTTDADFNEATPLTRAAYTGNTHIAKLLIEHGAEVNKLGLLGNTALSKTLREGHTNGMVELLLENGADPMVIGYFGESSLELAAKEKRIPLDTLQNIVYSMASVRSKYSHLELSSVFSQSVRMAYRFQNSEKMIWLLDNVPDYIQEQTIKDIHHDLLLHTNVMNPSMETVKYLSQKVDVKNIQKHLLSEFLVNRASLGVMKVLITSATDPRRTPVDPNFGISENVMHNILTQRFDACVPMMYVQANIVLSRDLWSCIKLALLNGRVEDMANGLLANGCDIQNARSQALSFLPFSAIDSSSVSTWIGKSVLNPLTLKGTCRIRLRCHYAMHIMHTVADLPLPATIKDYVMLRDLPNTCL